MMRLDITFLFLFIIAMIFGAPVHAALTLSPITPGLATNAATGSYLNNQAGSLQRIFDTATRTYGPGTSTVAINGRSVAIATKVPLSTTAGTVVKNALKLNPYKIAGTLAAGYLIDQGIQWSEAQNQWQKATIQDGPTSAEIAACPSAPLYTGEGGTFCNNPIAAGCPAPDSNYWSVTWTPGGTPQRTDGNIDCYPSRVVKAIWYCTQCVAAQSTYAPMTDAEWDALSDPIPTVGSELPTAPYMDQGAPVGTAQFTPGDAIIGSPYTKADGSTAEPRARITDNLDGTVTIDTYEKPLTNPDGTPADTNAPITDTADEPTPTKDPCIDNPDRLGCVSLGEVTDTTVGTAERTLASITPASIGGVGSCPAPITSTFMGQSISFSYDLPCQAAGMLRPLILALAWLAAGIIFIGGVRQ